MRVLLLTPPASSLLKSVMGTSGQPLGLVYLATAADNHDVGVLDPVAEDMDIDSTVERVKSFDPQVLGISCTTPAIYGAYRIARDVKVWNPNIRVILGGPHATFSARECLEECPEIDIVVRGEADHFFNELLNALEAGKELEGIRGLVFRRHDKIVETGGLRIVDDLDSLPCPGYGMLPMEKYQLNGIRFATLITSRGCPFDCIYCSSSLLSGKRWRGHSPERVLDDIRVLVDDFGVREIEMLDDTFNLNRTRATEICKLLRKEGVDIFFSCSSRVDTIDQRLAHELSRAGCHTVYFGVESGDEDVLRSTGKGITLDMAVRAVSMAKKAGLHTLCSFILGLPKDTVQTVRKTMSFARHIGTDFAQFTHCTPFPGTRLYEMARSRGWLLTTDWSRYTTLNAVMRVPGVSPAEVSRLLRRAYLSFYLRPNFLIRQVVEGRLIILQKAIAGAITTYANSRRNIKNLS